MINIDHFDQHIVNSSVNLTDLLTLTFEGAEPCDHVMMDLLSSALRTLQQAQLLAGVFPSKVDHVSSFVMSLFLGGALASARSCS